MTKPNTSLAKLVIASAEERLDRSRDTLTEEEKELEANGFVPVGDIPLKPKVWVNKYDLMAMSDRQIEEMSEALAKRRFPKS